MMTLARGPCGDAFLDAYTCFMRSEAEVKGTDCFDKMNLLTKCWTAYNPDDIAQKNGNNKSPKSSTGTGLSDSVQVAK